MNTIVFNPKDVYLRAMQDKHTSVIGGTRPMTTKGKLYKVIYKRKINDDKFYAILDDSGITRTISYNDEIGVFFVIVRENLKFGRKPELYLIPRENYYNETHVGRHLTKGREYKVIAMEENQYVIIDDHGDKYKVNPLITIHSKFDVIWRDDYDTEFEIEEKCGNALGKIDKILKLMNEDEDVAQIIEDHQRIMDIRECILNQQTFSKEDAEQLNEMWKRYQKAKAEWQPMWPDGHSEEQYKSFVGELLSGKFTQIFDPSIYSQYDKDDKDSNEDE